MLNNVKESIIKAKKTIKAALIHGGGHVACTYNQSGRVVEGFIIDHLTHQGDDVYELLNTMVRVQSHTGKEYYIKLPSVLVIEGIEEL